MPKVYSDDLRRKLLEAHQRGEGSLPSLAVRFKLTGQVRERLRAWIAAQADLTLAELRGRLAQELDLSISVGRLWTVLREMNLRLKKSRFTLPSRTPKRAGGNARSGGSRWAGSTRNG